MSAIFPPGPAGLVVRVCIVLAVLVTVAVVAALSREVVPQDHAEDGGVVDPHEQHGGVTRPGRRRGRRTPG